MCEIVLLSVKFLIFFFWYFLFGYQCKQVGQGGIFFRCCQLVIVVEQWYQVCYIFGQMCQQWIYLLVIVVKGCIEVSLGEINVVYVGIQGDGILVGLFFVVQQVVVLEYIFCSFQGICQLEQVVLFRQFVGVGVLEVIYFFGQFGFDVMLLFLSQQLVDVL